MAATKAKKTKKKKTAAKKSVLRGSSSAPLLLLPRNFVVVSWDKATEKWGAKMQIDGFEIHLAHSTKSVLVRALAVGLSYAWSVQGVLSELVIRNKSGRIQDRRTYGLDPRRRKG